MPRARHVITAFSGARLREQRLRAGFRSQEALGRRLAERAGDPSVAAVTRERLKVLGYENGNHQPSAKGLHALADVLQVQPAELLDPDAPVTLELLRALRNLTQGQVAQRLGISQARYSQLENGQADIDERRAELAAILQVEPGYLDRVLSGTAAEEPPAP
ncbi:helix-turn-helix transcriptional regulator [Actinoplanes sp. G11-F43]|uniref:helix-turn-helix transcriptional regulator n=1 Tax=Actinoplanes sp. G11-F43 TaxID=3424130 RepID=UPI003D34FDEA